MITGSLPALVTPFENGKVDVDALKKLVDWHIDQGSHGLVPVGTTGESPTLTHEEHDMVEPLPFLSLWYPLNQQVGNAFPNFDTKIERHEYRKRIFAANAGSDWLL